MLENTHQLRTTTKNNKKKQKTESKMENKSKPCHLYILKNNRKTSLIIIKIIKKEH